MLKKMRESMCGYSIKNLKSMMGHDGYIWSCDIYFGKTKVAHALDQGYGGPVEIDYTNAEVMAEFKRISAIKCPDFSFEQDCSFAAELADLQESINKIIRKCKKQTLIQLTGDEADTYRAINVVYSAEVAEVVRARYGTTLVCIINEEV